MSYENKKTLLMSFESIPIVLRYEFSECMVKITITELNGGYIDMKSIKMKSIKKTKNDPKFIKFSQNDFRHFFNPTRIK